MCLSLMGFWPGAANSRAPHLLWALSNFVILFIGVITELMAGFSAFAYDLELALDTLCPAGTSAVTLLKMLFISYYRRDLREVLERLQRMLYDDDSNSRFNSAVTTKQRIIHRHAIMATRLNFAPFVSGFITCTSYNLKPMLIAWFQWANSKTVDWKTPFNMALPSVLLQGPYFILAYLFTAYTGYVTIFSFGGCDSFYFEFCAYISALLHILQADIKSAFKACQGDAPLSEEESRIFELKFSQIVKRHNDIIELTHFFRDRYAVITLAHFVSASIVIGISIFDLMTFSGFGMAIYVLYTIAATGELFIYCYGGTIVAESSSQVATVLYDCNWHNLSPRLRRMVLLVMIRSQQPLSMAVPFFSPSLTTLASILKTSGSIIALASSFR